MAEEPLPVEETISNQVAVALQTTIANELGDYIVLPTEFDSTHIYLMSAVFLEAASSPCICIDERGDTLRTQCAGGVDAAGTFVAGFEMRDYKFDVEVWIEAREAETAREKVNIYRDGITALLNDYETLGGYWVSVKAQSGEPAMEGVVGSRRFWGGVVHCTIAAGIMRGQLALAGTT